MKLNAKRGGFAIGYYYGPRWGYYEREDGYNVYRWWQLFDSVLSDHWGMADVMRGRLE